VDESTIVKELLLDLHKDFAVLKADMAAIKEDLKYHIKRTDTLEAEVKWMHRQMNMVHGAIALVAFLGTLAGMYKSIKG
jgi:phosphatidylserine/phosphatidylglycerophosphate/cardiolipin synthase-like enzyme